MRFNIFHRKSRSEDNFTKRNKDKENITPLNPLQIKIPHPFDTDELHGTPLIEAVRNADMRPIQQRHDSYQQERIKQVGEAEKGEGIIENKEWSSDTRSFLDWPLNSRQIGSQNAERPPPVNRPASIPKRTLTKSSLALTASESPIDPVLSQRIPQPSQSPPSLTSSTTVSTRSSPSCQVSTSPGTRMSLSRQAKHNLISKFLQQYEELSEQRDRLLEEQLEHRKTTERRIEQLMEEHEKLRNLLTAKGIIDGSELKDTATNRDTSVGQDSQPIHSNMIQPQQPQQTTRGMPVITHGWSDSQIMIQPRNLTTFNSYDTYPTSSALYQHQLHPANKPVSYAPISAPGQKYFGDQVMKEAQQDYGIYKSSMEALNAGGHVPTMIYDPVTKVKRQNLSSSRVQDQTTQQMPLPALHQQQTLTAYPPPPRIHHSMKQPSHGGTRFQEQFPSKAITGTL